MGPAGAEIGRKWGAIPNAAIVLPEEDAGKIEQWRKEHPRGRPAKKEGRGGRLTIEVKWTERPSRTDADICGGS